MSGSAINIGSNFTVELRSPNGSCDTVIKYPTAAIPSSSVLARLEREYEIGTELDLPRIRHSITRLEWKGRPAIELEYVPGDDFKSYFQNPQHRRIEIVLQLALSAAEALASLHASGVIHRDLAASNLLVSADTQEAIIIDLGFASRIGDGDDFVFSAKGQLPYISPEQTGRIDLPVDERSDLYSFGVVFYEMLTGDLPFQAEDASGWIHSHLARLPEPPHAHEASISRAVSNIVLKMLAKTPENRYQSARGLSHDLQHCLSLLRSDGVITDFPLGHGDHSRRLRFPSKLYGRIAEQEQLRSIMDQAISGKPGLQFISGYAGSGKTSLVNELRFPFAAVGGYFISGKFDQTLRGLPYIAFADAFTQYCHRLLAGTPEELTEFRNRVLENLGANVGLLLELVPLLESIIGPQKAPPQLDTFESANRFTMALLGLFHCMVSKEHPLILFLDDLHWADAASLELVHLITTRAVCKHFLLVCAYREDEIEEDSQLPELIKNLQNELPQIQRMPLTGLSLEHSSALVADALETTEEQTGPLNRLINAKTGGNPFFMRQLLKTLVSEDALYFDPDGYIWRWENERIQMLDISDNVIELMLRKITRLPENVRNTLQVAACIGNTFDLKLLANTTKNKTQDLRALIAPAIEEGLVALLGVSARFTHDRIQQAVYQTLNASEAQHIHLQLGRYLLRQRKNHDLSLVAIQQINLGSPLIETDTERRQLAELNLEAGDASREAMAYAEARGFYAMGASQLTSTEKTNSRLWFELQFHQAEITFYLGEVESAIKQLLKLLDNAPDILSVAHVYQLLLDIYTTELDLHKAMVTGMDALAALNVALPEDHSEEALLARIQEVDRVLAERGINRLDDWPQMTDERELAIVGLLTHLMPPAYISGAEEVPFIMVELARRSLQGGLSRFSPFALSAYGMLLASSLNQREKASLIGQLAMKTVEYSEEKQLRARANFFVATFIMHWTEPLEATLPYLDEGWKSGVENGDLQFASYCINHMHSNSLFAGQSLKELVHSFEQFSDIDQVIRQEDGHYYFMLLKTTAEALHREVDKVFEPAAKIGGIARVESWLQLGNATMVTSYYILRCLLSMVMNRQEDALDAAEKAAPGIYGLWGMTWEPQHNFLHALALADAVRDERREHTAAMEQIDSIAHQLEEMAALCSENYGPKWLLVKAEMAELNNTTHGVLLDVYDEAISVAMHSGRIIEQALACERAAECWKRRDKLQLAGMYLQQALQAYRTWGAEAKAAQLLHDQAALLLPLLPYDSESSTSSSSSSSDSPHAVDIYSVLKAAQTVAGELVMDRMLSRLIGLVIETAGAEIGYLLLKQEKEWCVVAERHQNRASVEVLQWRPLGDYPDIAATVVQYVTHTSKTVNLDDATKSTLFAADASIAKRHCKSLLCMPIINRGELTGVLYLENNLSAHAFTRTHTRTLQLLTTQAISSLEISRYYARVQDLNRSLEEEIDERKRTESQLEFLANHDSLTNLPNRRLFYDRVQHAIQRVQRNGGRVAVLFLDIDRFKNINDTLSHQIGDRFLQQVAQRLERHVREEDTLARLGGDEYVLLMDGDINPYDLSLVAEKLLATFREPVLVEDHNLEATGSIGISIYPDDSDNTDQLLRNADAAMYQAKQSGRNTYRYFSAGLAEAAAERLVLEHDLRRAIENEEFELYFQPQVDLESGAVIGAEVLLRWNHPLRGFMLPDSFIPVAEDSGSLIAIGEWVLRQSCRQLELWREEGIEIGSLAINVSSKQLHSHGRFVEHVKSVLEDIDITPSVLEFELTESVILQDTESLMESLQELTALGIRLAIDDFGTGYSSLSYLHRLPMQRLKIDRSFVSRLPEEEESSVIVQSILLLGHNLKKQVIAEGVETEAQRSFLIQAGCKEGQGYLFGAPMPLKAFAQRLQSNRGHGGE